MHMSDERTKEDLKAENERLRKQRDKLRTAFDEVQERMPQVDFHPGKGGGGWTRRGVIATAATAAGLGAAGYYSGKAAAQTTGSGEIASQSNPALRVYVNRVHLVDLGSEPSSPGDGSIYYNSNA